MSSLVFLFPYILLLIQITNSCGPFQQCKWSQKYLLVEYGELIGFWEAEQYCLDTFNTHLASVLSNEELQDSATECRRALNNAKCWIGLHDNIEELNFTWT